ncbi:amidase domain-containing protein [Paenibacillus kyungheensis]|uniref:Amidase domain-containing protein n=1 Tax=Paenibacillus kyungheensis TaxID=1452732 RepID=A0AAX3M2N3_9BACL|nr:amidase domain-containing protein [Paenibacillus kyungheensis]WCT56514.1 amidase domain-containing protein [Paenibacillus kyungheensis]
MRKSKKFLLLLFIIFTFFVSQLPSNALAESNQLHTDSLEYPQTEFREYINNVATGKVEVNIPNLIETTVTKEEAEKKYAIAIKIIKDYININSITIEQNLDNTEYQLFIKGLGTSLDDFSSKDRNYIIEFVKFMDFYENKEKNKQIKNFKNKLYTASINENELNELYDLIPVSSSDPITVQSSVYEIQSSVHESVYEDKPKSFLTPNAYSNGYSSINARDYAYKWWNGRNPTYSNYYANYNKCSLSSKACWAKWNDCTNFVSQALYAGGMSQWKGPYLTGDNAWYFSDNLISKPSHSWGGANNFYHFWRTRTTLAASASKADMGDPVNADFTKDGDIDHTALITLLKDGHFYVTQHTDDKKNNALSSWYSAGYNVYIWKMNNAAKSPNER